MGSEDIEKESFQYLAVSYTWDPSPTKVKWQDREVTVQSLNIAEVLSKYTSLPLWIDAICIPQDDLGIKMQELRKMADIYRRAAAVLCLVPDMQSDAAEIVHQAMEVMHSDSYLALGKAGDVYGCYMFATAGEHSSIRSIYGSRWWERGWTFQEAVLNQNTFLVGPKNETVLISDLWRIAPIIHKRSTTSKDSFALGRPATFWDSVATMTVASSQALSLGDAIACIWRREVTNQHDLIYSMLGVCGLEDIHPDYNIAINDVLISLFTSASQKGDYSWIRWCDNIDQSKAEAGMCMVPKPNDIYNLSAMPTISTQVRWQNSILPGTLPAPRIGSEKKGMILPHRSLGVARFKSPPLSLAKARELLKQRELDDREVWDTIFGMRVGFVDDIEDAIGTGGFSRLLFDTTLMILDGSLPVTQDLSDMPGLLSHTTGISYTNYSIMAAKLWRDKQLVILECQAGITTVPSHKGEGNCRIHKLPYELKQGVHVVMVVYDNTRHHSSGIGLLIQKSHTGLGSWQLTRFGSESKD